MDSIKIELKPRTPDYSVALTDFDYKPTGSSALVAYASLKHQDGSHAGVSLSLQASPMETPAPTAEDAELFFRTVALLNAAPQLLEALVELRDWYTSETGLPAARANAAIAAATTHPLRDQMEAEQREHEERAESARPVEHDDDRDHLTDDNTDFGDDLDEAARAYTAGADDIDPETLQGAADAARETAAEERLLGGAA